MAAACKVVAFDQCMTGLQAMKTTQLLVTPNAYGAVAAKFGNLICKAILVGALIQRRCTWPMATGTCRDRE